MAGPVMLIIRDGWGINAGGRDKRKENGDATLLASTPFHDKLYRDYPWSRLSASGENVGLPDGQMGNSEVGHLNIGAGRIVYQDLVKINLAIRDKSFFSNPVLLDAFAAAKKGNKKVHLIGLVSDGGVHSHISHLKALCDMAKQNDVSNVFIHAFTDGRDTDPKSGVRFIQDMQAHLKNSSGTIASL